MRKKPMVVSLSLLLTGCMLLAGCSTTDKPAANGTPAPTAAPTASKAGGTVNIAIFAYPTKLDPKYSLTIQEKNVYQSLYDKLLDIDAKGNLVPMLAEKWEISSDKKEYTFHLRQGVKFHDGTDFNAESVKFNFERNMEEDSLRRNEIKDVDSLTVVDPYTIKIMLKQPFSPFLSVLTEKSGMMVSPDAAQKSGKDFVNKPVGTGPYMFKETLKGSSLTLDKNPNYWKTGLPKADKLVYKIIEDSNVALVNLKSGDVDISDKVPFKELEGLANDAKVTLVNDVSFGTSYVYLNTSKPPFDKKEFRQAVDLMIDRDALVKIAINGAGTTAHSPFSSRNFAHGNNDQYEKPNLEKAKDLMKKAGMDSASFSLKVGTLPKDQQVGQMIQNMLKPLGVDVKLEKLEYGSLDEQIISGNYDMGLTAWSGRQDPDQSIYDWFISKGPRNFARYTNPELDKLLNAGRAEVDQEKRKLIYDQVMNILHEDVPVVYLYHENIVFGMSKAIQGFEYVPDFIIHTANLGK